MSDPLLFVDTSESKVGVGTNAPNVKLHVGGGDVGIDRDQKFDFGAGYSANWYIKQKSDDNKLYFERTGGSGNELVIDTTRNVGIGTASPDKELHVYGSIKCHNTDSTGTENGLFLHSQGDWYNLSPGNDGYLHLLGGASGQGNMSGNFSSMKVGKFITDDSVSVGGPLYVGIRGKDAGAASDGRKNIFIQSTYGGNTSQNYGWWIGAQNQNLHSTDNDMYFSVVRNGSYNQSAYIQDSAANIRMNFTGQHRTFVKDTPTNQLVDKEGLIVSADQNEFVKMSGGVVCGNEAITVNESLPLVSLSTKANDKKCFGVLSTTEDPETRKEVHGNFVSNMQKEEGDTRVYVNSVGEGAVWVTNINGTLESGDYITTSNVAGYGMKQNDDILHNYTVAKILMDCDFNPVTQPKRIIKKEPKMVDYWILYGDVEITEEEYNTLPDSQRKIADDVHYRIDQMEVVKEDPEKDGFVYEQREDIVNVLDEHGQFQWEDSSETEKAYKTRYLDANGNVTDEANAVHVAAFVGCTYHCG